MKLTTKILMQEIFEVTTKIQTLFPELYTLLCETPLFLCYSKSEISNEACKQYLETLQLKMEVFVKK